MRIVTIIAGMISVISGIWCLANPGETFFSLAFVLGIVMLFSGVSGIFAYLSMRIEKDNGTSGWILADGMLSVILSLLVLSNQLVTDAVIPLFFGMWVMFSGIMRIAAALAIKGMGKVKERVRGKAKSKARSKSWGWMFALGIISVLAGVYSFINPVAAGLAIVMLVGIFFILQGVNILAIGIQMNHQKK